MDGLYKVLMVRPNNSLFSELCQADDSDEATKTIKGLYPDAKHVSTDTRVVSTSERKKAEKSARDKVGKAKKAAQDKADKKAEADKKAKADKADKK